jgi:NNP family nitrate/nitrite transporter-like MFS transporter
VIYDVHNNGATHADAKHTSAGTWLKVWTPEDPGFWENTGKPLAWKTLTITTLNLMMAFIVWFVVSAPWWCACRISASS